MARTIVDEKRPSLEALLKLKVQVVLLGAPKSVEKDDGGQAVDAAYGGERDVDPRHLEV
jgi:hypothetical protein